MSRCFPFPPPGYEKKARVDDTNLLTKEKEKEKKHKKEKKDKEKKENKEKNDKGRSKEKKREKKDRKEKHKDRDKEKEKTRNSDGKRANGQTSLPKEHKLGSNSLQSNENKDAKFVQELVRRISDENKVSGSQMPHRNVAAADQRGIELFRKAIQPGVVKQLAGKESGVVKVEDNRKVNGQRNHIYDRGLEKALGEISNLDKERSETIPRPVEKKSDMQVGGKEKTENKDGHSKGQSNKDREKDRKSRDEDQNQEKKKEEKVKEMNDASKEEHKAREGGPRLKDNSRQSLDSQGSKPQKAVKLSFPNSASNGNVGKRKECEMNGFLIDNSIQPNKLPKLLSADNGIQPNKLPRPLSASPLANENGRKLESSQTASQFGTEKQVPSNNDKMDLKESKINGLIPSQRHDAHSSVPGPPRVLLSQNGEASLKPPHPDTKYLSQILSVPILEELPDFDDQDWLLSSNMQSKKSNMASPQIDNMRQVWAEARWIESADISALPYVIPY